MKYISLDKIDLSILRQMQQDATLSVQNIADRIGLSPTSCWRRLRKLQDDGVIRKQVALLDSELLNLNVNVIAQVKLREHSEEILRKFEQSVAEIPEVVECYSVSGDTDFLLRMVVRDVAAYENLLYTKLVRILEMGTMNSMFALRQVKYTTELPIDSKMLSN